MSKIVDINTAAKYSEEKKSNGKSISLVLGSFDIVHLGHLNLFRHAKKTSDFVIVGLDSDGYIKKIKGDNRPINDYSERSEFLSDIETIDLIFPINNSPSTLFEEYLSIVEKISPTCLVTHKVCDKSWEDKTHIADKLNIKIYFDETKRITNSGEILRQLENGSKI